MSSELTRIHIVSSKEQDKKFKKFRQDAGYSSLSQMFRDSVIKNMKKFYSKKSEEAEKLQEDFRCIQDTLFKKINYIQEFLELITMRLNKEGINSEVGPAMSDILNLLIIRDKDHSEILLKCRNHDDKTLDTALNLLIDTNMIGKNKNKGWKNI